MQHNSGAPAFDNIDDLLADKIVKHSKKHTDHPEPDETIRSTEQSDRTVYTSKRHEKKKESPHSLTAILTVVLIAIGLLYLVTRSSRNS